MMECEQCKRKFARKDNLTRHMLIHARPVFKCKVCPETFDREDRLERHAYCHRRVIVASRSRCGFVVDVALLSGEMPILYEDICWHR